MERWMNTRRSAKQQNIVVETDSEADRIRDRMEASKRCAADIPDEITIDRYSDDYEDADEQVWCGSGPSTREMDYYFKETKNRGISIDTAHNILCDYGMDVKGALSMILDNDLVPADLMSPCEKLMLKALAPVLGVTAEHRKTEWPIGRTFFPGHNMTTIYDEAFKTRLDFLSDHNGDIRNAKQEVKRQFSQLVHKRESYGKSKKSGKSRNCSGSTNSSSSGSPPDSPDSLASSVANTSNDSIDEPHVPSQKNSTRPKAAAPGNAPVPSTGPKAVAMPMFDMAALAAAGVNNKEIQKLYAELEEQMKILNKLAAGNAPITTPTIASTVPASPASTEPAVPELTPQPESPSSLVQDVTSEVQEPSQEVQVSAPEHRAQTPPIVPTKQEPAPCKPSPTLRQTLLARRSLVEPKAAVQKEPITKNINNVVEDTAMDVDQLPSPIVGKPLVVEPLEVEKNDSVQLEAAKEEASIQMPEPAQHEDEVIVLDDSLVEIPADCGTSTKSQAQSERAKARIGRTEAIGRFTAEVKLALSRLHKQEVAAIALRCTKDFQNIPTPRHDQRPSLGGRTTSNVPTGIIIL